MQRISITNPQNVIDGTAKKYYFKLRNTGGPKGDKGDKGDTGATGPQGPQGNAATVSVGSTTTLPVGYDATVTNSGSIYNAVLDFGIPQGPQGPQGAKGDKGDTGARGETGPRGPQGERGTNATVYVGTTTTTNPGTQARVYNSGTDSNAVLNFEIPRGDVGPQPELAQTTGTSTTKAMSQNATTEALATKQNTINSSNKLSADLVNDTNTTNKFVTASEKATWNAKQNALTAGDNITISGDTISTPAIVPEVVAELPPTGTEGKLYLTPKAHTSQTAIGNPITATITDGAGSMESFQLDGDTYQQNYEGKNLIEPKMASAEFNGVTCSNNGDGSFTLNGTATSTATFRLDQSTYQAHDNLKSYSGEYTLSCNELTNGMDLVVMQQTTWTQYMRMRNSNAPVTATLNATDAFIYVGVAAGATVNNLTIRPMLEKGSTATSFEPYVGGVPSPNPDYPQAIQTVTGEQTVTVVGKNLFDKNTRTIGILNGDGTIGFSNDYYTSDFIQVVPDTTYHKTQTTSARLKFYDINKTPISSVYDDIPNAGDAKSFTTPSSCYYIRFSYRYDTKDSIQLEKGSTATAYAPYSKHTYEINLGKNLFDNTGWEQGQYSDGVWSGGNTKRATSGFIPVEGGTYTMSLNSTDNKTALINLNYFDSAKTWLGNRANLGLELFGYTDRVKTFTLPNNASYLRVTVRPYGGDYQGDNIIQYAPSENLQVEAGSTATTYAPYFTPIELCKLDTYQDYIYKDGDDWKVHKATSFHQIESSSVGAWTNYSNIEYATIRKPQGYKGYETWDGADVISDHATFDRGSGLQWLDNADRVGKIIANASVTNYWIGFIKGTSLDSMKSSLDGAKILYPLETPTDTTITDQTLIAQLEAIRTASLENGANTITNAATDSNLAGDMEIGYYGYNPRNRYDKWLWLDINNEYEQIGS